LKQPHWSSFSTADPIGSLRAISEQEWFKKQYGWRLKHPKKPFLLDPNRALYEYVGRDVSISSLLRFFSQKARLIKTSESSKVDAIHAATCGSPGTGKSRFIDEVAKLNEWSREKLSELKDAEFIEAVKDWVPLCVSFNGKTSFNDKEKYQSILSFSFALRLLVS
jgi:hypothetical protein